MTLARRARVLMIAAWLALLAIPFLPAATFACSCALTEVADLQNEPTAMVFSGVIQPDDERGVPVIADRWWKGVDRQPVVWLDQSGFLAQDGMCGTARPGTGTFWIFAITEPGSGPTVHVSLCTLHGQIGTEQGEAIVADATRVFGQGEAVAAPETAAEDDAALWLGGAALLGALGVVVLTAIVWRARATDW